MLPLMIKPLRKTGGGHLFKLQLTTHCKSHHTLSPAHSIFNTPILHPKPHEHNVYLNSVMNRDGADAGAIWRLEPYLHAAAVRQGSCGC